MESFKIENYERMHGLKTFMPFRQVPVGESHAIAKEIISRLGLPLGTPLVELARAVRNRSVPVENVSAVSEAFNLGALLNILGLDASGRIYLNWRHYDNLDEVKISNAIGYFNDYWYPSTDDLDLVDLENKWILSIDHDGCISFLRLFD